MPSVSQAKFAVKVAAHNVKCYQEEADLANADYHRFFKALQFAKANGAQEAEVAMVRRLVAAQKELDAALHALKIARAQRHIIRQEKRHAKP